MRLFAVFLVACSSTTIQTPAPLPADSDAGGASLHESPLPAACVTSGEVCSASTSACCNGAICAGDAKTPAVTTCHDACLSNAQCKSGCCTTLAGGTAAICAAPSYCCAAVGSACGAGAQCCGDAVCKTYQGVSTCADRCTAHAQCKSGCCAPLGNSSAYVCSDPAFCR